MAEMKRLYFYILIFGFFYSGINSAYAESPLILSTSADIQVSATVISPVGFVSIRSDKEEPAAGRAFDIKDVRVRIETQLCGKHKNYNKISKIQNKEIRDKVDIELDKLKKEREENRKSELRERIEAIQNITESVSLLTSVDVKKAIDSLQNEKCICFDEYSDIAIKAKKESLESLNFLLVKKEKEESEAIEFEKLTKEQAER
ncbi:MAG: hypothetical protein IIC66_04805 [candidate division Zixibacteria bacterium]|nr:hypothetical protein [candidate division Zixibacteria bacterium]